MRILVFGAGAVGQAVGCMLSVSGHSVDLIIRQRYLEALRSGGLQVTGIFGDYTAPRNRVRFFDSMDDISDQTYDYVLVTTKSYDTPDAVSSLLSLRDQSFFIVSMQNGCGNVECLTGSFGDDRTLGARVITGFAIINPGLVRITVTADAVHIGGVHEGDTPSPAIVFADMLSRAGLPAEPTAYIFYDLYAKLLYNSALNPLGAALGVHYGALGDDPDARQIMDRIIDEVFSVLDSIDGRTHWDTADEYRQFFYGTQIPATYDHRSSMLQDLEAGKRTEIDALTGWVADHGKNNGIQTPVCDTITAMIRFLERSRRG